MYPFFPVKYSVFAGNWCCQPRGYLVYHGQICQMHPGSQRRLKMPSKTDEMILKTAKEIIVKFIETRTVTPATFNEHFQNIYAAVEQTVRKNEDRDAPEYQKK